MIISLVQAWTRPRLTFDVQHEDDIRLLDGERNRKTVQEVEKNEHFKEFKLKTKVLVCT